MHIKNNSSTLIIVLHEIYGINTHIQSVCNDFAATGALDVLCPNLLSTERVYTYSQTAEAYQSFTQQVGFVPAAQQVDSLCRMLRDQYDKLFIVGFSVGATVAWLCSQNGIYDGVIGYYGSRIRDFTATTPSCPVLLFFPSREDAFSVDVLIDNLSGRRDIQIEKVSALHGFADPWSENYCRESSQSSMQRTLEFVRLANSRFKHQRP